MARFRLKALSELGRARLLAVLLGISAIGLAGLSTYWNPNILAMIGAIIAALGGLIGVAGVIVGREEYVLWGSLLAMAGSGFTGAFGLQEPRHELALTMIGAVLCSLALYELGTTAAIATNYFAVENVRERHDMAAVEEMLREQGSQSMTLVGIALLLTLALYAVGALLAPAGGGSIAVAGTLAAVCITAAALLLVLRGGKMAPDAPPTAAGSYRTGTGRPVHPSGMAGPYPPPGQVAPPPSGHP